MDNWNQQPTSNQNVTQSAPNGGAPRRSGLLSGYGQQQPLNVNQYSPVSTPASMDTYAGPNTPPGGPPNMAPPRSQGPGYRPNGLLAGTFEMVRRFSGKMAAVAGYSQPPQPPPPQPMELYHARSEPIAAPLPQAKQWKRSRSVRIAMQMRRRRERWQGSHMRIGSWLLISALLVVVVLTFSGSAYAYGYYQTQLPRVQQLANQSISQTTHIYDRNGTLLFDAYDQNIGTGHVPGRRTPVSYNDIPQVMQDAMIAAEDPTFWDNSGIDPRGIIRAATEYAQTHSVQSGGSTITQQLIKNMTGDNQVTIDRKLGEGALAIGLTQQYPKWKILEMYFNVSPFGRLDLGVESAVEEYFHLMPTCDMNFKCVPGIKNLDYNQATKKHDPLLGLARASLLAGVPNNPTIYDPTAPNGKQAALGRQQYVLSQMMANNMSVNGLGPITPQIAQKAENLMANTTFTPYQHIEKAPDFVDWVIGQVETALGNGDSAQGVQMFLTGGFNIRTTVDANLEDYVERAVKRHLMQPEYQKFTGGYGPLNIVNNVNDAAVVVMDAKTGEVLAMDGSSNYNSTDPRVAGQFNAALSPRQPGSSFKPIVYSTAFEMGWYPGMVLPDFKAYFPNGTPNGTSIDNCGTPQGKTYCPSDYGNTYHNTMSTIRVATANSFNIPAVEALQFVGPDNAVNTAERMGITGIKPIGDSLVLGSEGVSPLQMTGAYQVFADGGMRVPPQGVLDIWDNYGHHLYHYDPTHPPAVQVLSPQVAYLMTSVLMDEPARAAEFPGDHDLSFADQTPACAFVSVCANQVAAKTGTTDSFKDNWTIGYTPNVVVSVWVGNADDTPFTGNVIGITGAAPIWHSVIERADGYCPIAYDGIDCGNYTTNYTQKVFPVPDGLQTTTLSAYDGLQGTGNIDLVIDGTAPLQPGAVQPQQNPTNNNGNTTTTRNGNTRNGHNGH